MLPHLGDLLTMARRRRFVGRASEQKLFQTALTAPELPFHVLHVFGPGGVGKTTLLGAFAALADRAGVPVTYVDARNLDPTPAAFTGALCLALGIPPDASPLDVLGQANRHVLLVDTLVRCSARDWSPKPSGHGLAGRSESPLSRHSSVRQSPRSNDHRVTRSCTGRSPTPTCNRQERRSKSPSYWIFHSVTTQDYSAVW